MVRNFLRSGSALALAASLFMAAGPALAHDRWHYHHRDRISAGDVLAGVLIVGGIAAIAHAASQPRERIVYRQPYPDTRPEYRPEQVPRPPFSGRFAGDGINNAVDMCLGQVERGEERAASVDSALRSADGWRISGQLERGGAFACWIDNDGRIRSVDLDGGDYGSSYGEPAGAQWDDDAYARARARQRAQGSADPGVIDADLAAAAY